METVETGHRTAPTTSGAVVEAWGPTRAACFSEAAHGLVAAFADVSPARTAAPATVHLDPDDDEGMLAALVEEVLCLLHVLGVVPVDGALVETQDGGLAGCFDVAPAKKVALLGPLPRTLVAKHVRRSDDGTLWRCEITVRP